MKKTIEFDLKLTFQEFKKVCLIAVYFSEGMDLEEIDEVINDWFVIYKESGFDDPVHFLEYQQLVDVTRNTHSFWLSPSGVMLLKLNDRSQ